MFELTTQGANLPAFFQRKDLLDEAARFNANASAGIKVGGFPRISLYGSKFFVLDGGERRLIEVDQPGVGRVPAGVLDVVIVGASPFINKLYYEGPYIQGEDREPDCSADDGQFPDPHIAEPEHANCTECPMNAWGSKINDQNKEIKACSDNKRIVVVPLADLKSKACAITVTPTSLKEWGKYTKSLHRNGMTLPIYWVVTRIRFDPNVSHPRLLFEALRLLTDEEFSVVEERMKSDEVKFIEQPNRGLSPRRAAPALPQAAQAPVAPPAPAAPAPAVAPPPPPPPPPDPYAGLPPATAAAVKAVGGIDTPAGQAVLRALSPPVAPTADSAVAGVLSETAAVGDNTAQIVASAAAGVLSETQEVKKRTRRTAPVPAAPAPAPAAPAPAAAATGFASTTAPVVNDAGLASIIGSILGKPTEVK